MGDILLFLSVFAASIVEGVEALTIILAVGTSRGWRSTWYGVAAASATLIVIVALLGPALTLIPIAILRIVVGGLLLIFGLQWLRKAILRASGFKSLHDEDAIFDKAVKAARNTHSRKDKGIVDDWYSFTIAFKGVLLEGLEIAFIVVTFGANQGSVLLAIIGALAAILVVVVTGFIVHRPLSNVPENTLKFIVGIMLTSFGMFWGAEGVGVQWPGGDVALFGILAYTAITTLLLTVWLNRHSGQRSLRSEAQG